GYRYLMPWVLVLALLAGCATRDTEAPDPSGAVSPVPASTEAVQIAPYPIKNPMLATVLGTPKALQAKLPTDVNFSIETLPPLVERETPPTLRYARPLQYLVAAQDGPAPLAFII